MTSRRKLHVAGAAGKGTSGVAMLAAKLGHHVSASDLRSNHRTDALEEQGVEFAVGQDGSQMEGVDELVASGGVPEDNPLIVAARAADKPVLGRMQAMAELLGDREVLSVVGSLGKSTTTALAGATLQSRDPTVYMGADSSSAPCGVRIGLGDLAVVETCEYRDEMLHVSPAALLLTNLWPNHEDWFGTGTAGAIDSFARLIAERAPQALVACTDSPAVEELLDRVRGEIAIVAFGSGEPADFRIVERSAEDGGVRFRLRLPDGDSIAAWAPVPGQHGALDAAGALALALTLGVDPGVAVRDLAAADVPSRRFERRIQDRRLQLVDDNARLPIQIATTLAAARELHPGHRLVVVCGFWGRLNPRDLPATAAALAAADVVLPFELGGNALSAGGAEPDDSIQRLGSLCSSHRSALAPYSEQRLLAEVDGNPRVCVVTLGYDGELERFRGVERSLLAHLGSVA